MSDALITVRDVLVAAPEVTALCADRISPIEVAELEQLPYLVLSITSVEPTNAVDGYCGPDRCEVEVAAWAESFGAADNLARTARAALEAAEILCTGQLQQLYVSDREPGIYRAGYFFQVWQ